MQTLNAHYEKAFPSFGIKNIRLYYFISILSHAWFILANWLFYALKFVTPGQMGMIESAAFGLGLILEIPSGAIADLLGKKLTVQIGLFFQTLGIGMFLLAPVSPWFVLIGNITAVSSFAFTSGSFEALAYDSFVEHKKEQHFDAFVSRSSAIYPIVSILTALTGGLLWKFSIYLPWIATTICFILALILSFKLTEPTVDTYVFSLKQFIRQNKLGFVKLWEPNIRKFLPIFVTVLATYYMWGAGIIRISMGDQFGYNGETLSYMISFVMLISSLVVLKFEKIKQKLGNFSGLILLTTFSGVGWLLAFFDVESLFLGFLVFLSLSISGELIRPWKSSILNKNIPSNIRATVISTLQLFLQLPYVVIAFFYGYWLESGLANTFYVVVGIIIFTAILATVVFKKISK